jgi:putative endonuclease
MQHIKTGKQGEDAAARYLIEKGYRIAVRNFRAGRCEIDIIAWQHEDLLVFVEVKTRHRDDFGGPEEAVHYKKQDAIARTAGLYMEKIGYDWAIRFDILAVLMDEGQVREIRHTEDAFFPGIR